MLIACSPTDKTVDHKNEYTAHTVWSKYVGWNWDTGTFWRETPLVNFSDVMHHHCEQYKLNFIPLHCVVVEAEISETDTSKPGPIKPKLSTCCFVLWVNWPFNKSWAALLNGGNLDQSSVTSDTLLWNTSPQLVMCPLVSPASSSGTRLHRGYVEEAAPEDTPPETTHIVFVVHGIGQKMDQGRIIRNTSMWVNCSCSLVAAVAQKIELNQNHSGE